MTGAEAKETKMKGYAIFLGAVDEEERAEVVEEKPGGEEMEVVEENKVVNEVKVKAGPWPLNLDVHVSSLQDIQVEVETVRSERAPLQLQRTWGHVHQHFLEQRNYVVQNIPSFWVSAFWSHRQLSTLIRAKKQTY